MLFPDDKNGGKPGKMTAAALLTAAALIVHVVEAQIPPLTPVAGIKMGLSNIFTLAALRLLGGGWASLVILARILLGGLIAGQPSAILYSLAGGIPSFLLCVAVYRLFPESRFWVISPISAITHNLGQIVLAVFITQTPELFVYFPVLVISGIITGAFTGICAQMTISRLQETGALR